MLVMKIIRPVYVKAESLDDFAIVRICVSPVKITQRLNHNVR